MAPRLVLATLGVLVLSLIVRSQDAPALRLSEVTDPMGQGFPIPADIRGTMPGVNSFGTGRGDALTMHPTVKPTAMVADAILDCSKRSGIILDAFAGSGTTLVAAARTGRKGYGIEFDPHYCDVIVRRLTAVAGLEAINAATRTSFTDAERSRQTAPEGETELADTVLPTVSEEVAQ